MKAYTVENSHVIEVNILPSKSIIKKTVGNIRKTSINVDNLSAVEFKWLIFDEELQEYKHDISNLEDFIVEVGEYSLKLATTETLELDIEEPGTHKIRTVNDNATNDTKEVVIDA